MDRELWKKIESDKKAAQKKEAESQKDDDGDGEAGFGFMQGFADLNPELVANVTLVSRNPLRLMVEGALRFQSGKTAEVKKALDSFKNLFSDDESAEPMSLTVKDGKEGVYEFLLLCNLKRRVALPPPAHSEGRKRMSESVMATKPSAFLVLNSIRWVPLLAGTNESRSLRRLMTLADSVGASAFVSGKEICLSAEAIFRRERDVVSYAQDALAIVRDVEKVVSGPILRGLSAKPRGMAIVFSARIGIDDAWTTIGSLAMSRGESALKEKGAQSGVKMDSPSQNGDSGSDALNP